MHVLIYLLLWLVPFGLSFFLYWLVHLDLAAQTENHFPPRPDSLLTTALGLMLVTSFIYLFILLLLSAGWSGFPLLISFAGYIGISLSINRWFRQRRIRGEFLRSFPLKRMQFSLSDLYAAILVYGVIMALAISAGPWKEAGTDGQIALVIYLLIAQGTGLWICLDAIRRCTEPLSSWRRGALLVQVLVFSTFFFPLTVLSYFAWREALWKFYLKGAKPPNDPGPHA